MTSDFLCLDCGRDTMRDEYYMVHDHVWEQANPDRKGMLCIGCLEKRLTRKLTRADFTDAPVNWGGWSFFHSKRLKNRLCAT